MSTYDNYLQLLTVVNFFNSVQDERGSFHFPKSRYRQNYLLVFINCKQNSSQLLIDAKVARPNRPKTQQKTFSDFLFQTAQLYRISIILLNRKSSKLMCFWFKKLSFLLTKTRQLIGPSFSRCRLRHRQLRPPPQLHQAHEGRQLSGEAWYVESDCLMLSLLTDYIKRIITISEYVSYSK